MTDRFPAMTEDLHVQLEHLFVMLQDTFPGKQFCWSDVNNAGGVLRERVIYDFDTQQPLAHMLPCPRSPAEWHVHFAPASALMRDPNYDPDRRPGYRKMLEVEELGLPPEVMGEALQMRLDMLPNRRGIAITYMISKASIQTMLNLTEDGHDFEFVAVYPKPEMRDMMAHLTSMLPELED